MIRYLVGALIAVGVAAWCIGKAIEEYGREQLEKYGKEGIREVSYR